MANQGQDDAITTSDPPVPRETPGALAPHPIATPTYGAGGSFTIISSMHIAATPDVASAALLDHASWPEWNRFVRRVTVTSCPGAGEPAGPDAPSTSLEAAVHKDDGSRYLKKGMQMTFDVHLDPDSDKLQSRQGMEVTVLEPYASRAGASRSGWRVAWKSNGFPALLLRGERVQELVDDGRGGTEYSCWETMYGLLAPVVRLTVGKSLEKAFRCWTEDLKARAESIAAASGS